MMRIAWTRIGIPPDIADYLVQLDEGGTTILKTPYSLHHWLSVPYQSTIAESPIPSTYQATYSDPEFPLHQHQMPTFQAANGPCQGDVASSTIWACFLDTVKTVDSTICKKSPTLTTLNPLHSRLQRFKEKQTLCQPFI